MVLAIILAVIAVAVFIYIGAAFGDTKYDDDCLLLVFIAIFAIGLLVLSLLHAYTAGVGNLANKANKNYLKTNAIYETVAAKEDNGKVVAILREQDGDLLACELKKLPPPIFKAVENENDPYQPYPPNPK